MRIEGFNKADLLQNIKYNIYASTEPQVKKRPCVFLCHKREDKHECIKIAKYLSNAEIDYYLDIEDGDLQAASKENDALRITKCIKEGISLSTHMICVFSEHSLKSSWTPFEIGYGQAAILDNQQIDVAPNNIKLGILKLKGLQKDQLPDYVYHGYKILGIESLENYISEISRTSKSQLIKEHRISMYSNPVFHPLAQTLDIGK